MTKCAIALLKQGNFCYIFDMSQTPADPILPLAQLPFSILTDVMSPAEWHKRTRKACSSIPALDDVLTMIEKREVKWGDNIAAILDDNDITLREAELLFYLICEIKPILTVETGLGKGVAAAVMIAAHMHNGLNGGHVPLQKKNENTKDNPGVALLNALPLTGFQIMDHESALVLPQMYLQQLNDGLKFAYLNNATEFDVLMMEYFYVNQLLNEGGIIAIDTRERVRRELVDYVRRERHDYAVREIDETMTLIQKPQLAALSMHRPDMRH